MEINCNYNNIKFYTPYVPQKQKELAFCGLSARQYKSVQECADKFVRRPVVSKSATGLLGSKGIIKPLVKKIGNYVKNYKANIRHTVDHKIVYAIIERELFGKNSINSYTHDLDKLILFLLGFPKSFVTDFHRKHSAHHVESGKKMNLKSMICDNIASEPFFKPEKTLPLREYYKSSAALQKIDGFGDILERYNYGEDLNFEAIAKEKNARTKKVKGSYKTAVAAAMLFLYPIKFI